MNTTGWDYENTLYPGTRVLINRLGIRDAERLWEVEARVVEARRQELVAGVGDVTVSYDLRYLSDIHRHLFSDLYSWAGQPRTQDPFKEVYLGSPRVHFAPHGEVADRMGRVRDVVRDVAWADLGEQEAAGQLGAVYTAVFHAHPFREGNTRTLKVFMDQVAAHTRFAVGWESFSPLTWMAATVDAMPHEPGGRPDPRPFTEVIEASLTARAGEPTPVAPVPDRDLRMARIKALHESLVESEGQHMQGARGREPRSREDRLAGLAAAREAVADAMPGFTWPRGQTLPGPHPPVQQAKRAGESEGDDDPMTQGRELPREPRSQKDRLAAARAALADAMPGLTRPPSPGVEPSRTSLVDAERRNRDFRAPTQQPSRGFER